MKKTAIKRPTQTRSERAKSIEKGKKEQKTLINRKE